MTATVSPQEAAFKERLAAAPEDETARLVYADWLEENDRSEEAAKQRLMAPGYRALVLFGRSPEEIPTTKGEWCFVWYHYGDRNDVEVMVRAKSEGGVPTTAVLTCDWLHLLIVGGGGKGRVSCKTAEEAMESAAVAFASLPLERRTEILSYVHIRPLVLETAS